jgi:predicted nuclease of predicted toxin-antitoxin system
MKILIDMNLSPQWCPALRKHGHECLHWSEVGDPRATDPVIMEWARRNGHVVFTNDLDFGTLLALTEAAAPSVIQVRTQDLMPRALEAMIASLLRKYEDALATGALIVVDEARSRVRVLPLSR